MPDSGHSSRSRRACSDRVSRLFKIVQVSVGTAGSHSTGGGFWLGQRGNGHGASRYRAGMSFRWCARRHSIEFTSRNAWPSRKGHRETRRAHQQNRCIPVICRQNSGFSRHPANRFPERVQFARMGVDVVTREAPQPMQAAAWKRLRGRLDTPRTVRGSAGAKLNRPADRPFPCRSTTSFDISRIPHSR